jgi:hypothetical protein
LGRKRLFTPSRHYPPLLFQPVMFVLREDKKLPMLFLALTSSGHFLTKAALKRYPWTQGEKGRE